MTGLFPGKSHSPHQCASLDYGANMSTTVILSGRRIVRVGDNKMAGDRGLEPLKSDSL